MDSGPLAPHAPDVESEEAAVRSLVRRLLIGAVAVVYWPLLVIMGIGALTSEGGEPDTGPIPPPSAVTAAPTTSLPIVPPPGSAEPSAPPTSAAPSAGAVEAVGSEPGQEADAEPVIDVVLGEWALVATVAEAPPGPTTFRIRNAGTEVHAFRIRTAGRGRDRLEWRSPTIAPGEEFTMTADLPAGVLELDCPIEDGFGEHDELGMESIHNARAGAPPLTLPTTLPPTVAPPTPTTGGGGAAAAESAGPVQVGISLFAYEPAQLTVAAGTEVVWTNNDPAPHTATGDGFDTGEFGLGESAAVRFDTPGSFPYFCTLHPSMRAVVVVEP